jgi:hypothetical protein
MGRWAIATCLVALSIGKACADARSASLVESFRRFCTLELPTFSQLDAKATAMGLSLTEQREESLGHGLRSRVKGWRVSDVYGAHELGAVEVSGPDGGGVTCVLVAETRGDDAKQELMEAMSLEKPFQDVAFPEHELQVSSWLVIFGRERTILTLKTKTSPNSPGVSIELHQHEFRTP